MKARSPLVPLDVPLDYSGHLVKLPGGLRHVPLDVGLEALDALLLLVDLDYHVPDFWALVRS
jgi:hypothetical protein